MQTEDAMGGPLPAGEPGPAHPAFLPRLLPPLLVILVSLVLGVGGGYLALQSCGYAIQKWINPTRNVFAARLPRPSEDWVGLGGFDVPAAGAYEVWDEYRDGNEGPIPEEDYSLRVRTPAGEVVVVREGDGRTIRSLGLTRAVRTRCRWSFETGTAGRHVAEVRVESFTEGLEPYVAFFPESEGGTKVWLLFLGVSLVLVSGVGLLVGVAILLWVVIRALLSRS